MRQRVPSSRRPRSLSECSRPSAAAPSSFSCFGGRRKAVRSEVTPEPFLRIDRVSFAYRDREVVRDVALEIPRGERLGLLGPTGSGKSTLVRLLSRVLRPSTGRITLAARELDSYAPRELARSIAVVPQETALDFPFSVLEVVLMGRAPHLGGFGFEGDRDLAAAELAMARTGVSDL